jgi:hypothetical protein
VREWRIDAILGLGGAADGVDEGARGRGRSIVECGFLESRRSHRSPSMEIVGEQVPDLPWRAYRLCGGGSVGGMGGLDR